MASRRREVCTTGSMPGSTRKYSKSWLEFSRDRACKRYDTKASRFFWRSLSKTDCAIGLHLSAVYCACTAFLKLAAIWSGAGLMGGFKDAIAVEWLRDVAGVPVT